MKNTTEIIRDYSQGKTTLESANAALKTAGAGFHLDPARNTITPDEVGRFGLLDTGTGTLDKVEVKDGKLANMDCGEMTAYCFVGGVCYKVKGRELVEE